MITQIGDFTNAFTRIEGIDAKGTNNENTTHAKSLQANVQDYINKYEPIFLKALFGAEIAKTAESNKDIAKLFEAKPSAIAIYIYCHYLRDTATSATLAGEKLKNADYSSNVSPKLRIVRLWNMMVDDVRQLADKIEGAAPDCKSSIFEYMNQFGL